MNIQEYISSGIIESYVLGLSSPEENAEFEALSQQFPELVKARLDFEIALEKQLSSQPITPTAGLKEKVRNALRPEPHVNQTKIITMESTNNQRSGGGARLLAAASIILLLACAYFAYSFYTKNKDLEAKLASANPGGADQATLDAKMKHLQQLENEQQMMMDPNVAVVSLKGTEKAPRSSANIYWDTTSANVYLVVKNMPKLASDKQYQLWALIDSKPKDLGLFDVGDDGKIILKMSNTDKADAFAITVENRGNTGGPTLEQLQTMGKATL